MPSGSRGAEGGAALCGAPTGSSGRGSVAGYRDAVRVPAGAPRLIGAVAVVIAVLGVAITVGARGGTTWVGRGVGSAIGGLARTESPARTVDAYAGFGTWVDAFDFVPAYGGDAGVTVTIDDVDRMADAGVGTLFLQAAREDERSPGPLVDPRAMAPLIVRAHQRGMRVVGWYLPKFADVGTDLDHLLAIDRFEVAGHRFDGIAVDIEWTEDVPDPVERGRRLIDLSERLREAVGDQAVGAIVLPPVQTEVVNPAYWPSFPWRALADLYDVWLPMSYWTFRSTESGYGDGYSYNEESTRRLRANLGQPDAVVHGIGGIGDEATEQEYENFARSLADTASIGGSVYDYATTAPEALAPLAESVTAAVEQARAPSED